MAWITRAQYLRELSLFCSTFWFRYCGHRISYRSYFMIRHSKCKHLRKLSISYCRYTERNFLRQKSNIAVCSCIRFSIKVWNLTKLPSQKWQSIAQQFTGPTTAYKSSLEDTSWGKLVLTSRDTTCPLLVYNLLFEAARNVLLSNRCMNKLRGV